MSGYYWVSIVDSHPSMVPLARLRFWWQFVTRDFTTSPFYGGWAMSVKKCPVCHGRCTMPANFYDRYTTSARPVTCKSCDGKGYVVIPDRPTVFPLTAGLPDGRELNQ